MTEIAWLAWDDYEPMWVWVYSKIGDRKMRLFGCACCRAIWHRLTDAESRQAIEATARFVDGLATFE
jgi:hypothetical protein